MKQKSVLSILRLALTLFVITALVAGVLGAVNSVTAEPIAQAKAEKVQQAIAAVLPDNTNLQTLPAPESGEVKAVYASNGGYAIEVTPAGFGGTVDMMVGISKEGKVLGVQIVSHTETPGLGAVAAADNAKGASFRDQYVGLSGSLAVTKDGGTIDALTSATITSRAVTQGVNIALDYVRTLG